MLKYIRDENDMLYIFSFPIMHSDLVNALKIKPKSAVFLLITGENMVAYGKSTSLDVCSLPDDIDLIKKQIK